MNCERDAIHQAVRHLDGMDGERSDLETLARPDLAQVGVLEQSMLFQFVFHVGEREFSAPDWHIQFAQNPRQRPDVVFVSVGQDDAANFLPVLHQIGNIGYNNIDAEEFGFRKHEAGIDDNDVVPPAYGHAVHPELAQAAEGHNLQFSSWHAEY